MSLPDTMKKIKTANTKSTAVSSFISIQCTFFKKIEKETLKKNRERADILHEHVANWVDTFPVISKKYPDLFRSLVGVRFGETFPDIQLTLFSIFSGGYFNAVRNLRFTFESLIHAIYLEEKYPDVFPNLFFELLEKPNEEVDFQDQLEEKLRIMYPQKKGQFKDITGFKSKIIDRLFFLEDNEKKQLKMTYSKLSRLSHPAPDQIKKIINEPGFAFTFFYDEKFFNECAELTDEVMDAIFAIVLYKFPYLKQTIKAKENALLFDSLCRLPITKRLLDT
jgi:hypothetical protein